MSKPNVEYSLPRYDKYSFKFLTLGFDVSFHLGIWRLVFSVISVYDPPGTLAACCKPSSGAGVVWMEITLERLGSPPAMKNGDRLKVILLNSYFTRALNQPEENARQKSRSSLVERSGAQGREFEPRSRRSFSGRFSFDRDNVCTLYVYMCLFCTWCAK